MDSQYSRVDCEFPLQKEAESHILVYKESNMVCHLEQDYWKNYKSYEINLRVKKYIKNPEKDLNMEIYRGILRIDKSSILVIKNKVMSIL